MDVSVNETKGLRTIWRVILWGGLGLLLILPALAMSLGAPGVDWSTSDFVIMGVLMTAFGLGIEAAARFLKTWPARLAGMGLALLVFLAIWVELAVGVFGTPFAGS